MIIGIGIDIVDNRRIKILYKRLGRRFFEMFLNKEEMPRKKNKIPQLPHIAGLFAAKEAIIKATSNLVNPSLTFMDITITYKANGMPVAKLSTKKKILKKVGMHISISHEKDYSVAQAVGEIK